MAPSHKSQYLVCARCWPTACSGFMEGTFNATHMGESTLQVTLVGNPPWLHDLVRVLDRTRRAQLRRIRSFLKLETCRQYTCPRTGKTKCVGYLVSSSLIASEWYIHLFMTMLCKVYSPTFRWVARISKLRKHILDNLVSRPFEQILFLPSSHVFSFLHFLQVGSLIATTLDLQLHQQATVSSDQGLSFEDQDLAMSDSDSGIEDLL